MADNKTRATDAPVDAYLAERADEKQRADCAELMALFASLTGQGPKLWGPSIVGYGSYRYTYDSGHGGEAPLAAFAIRGRDLVVYLSCDDPQRAALLARLGKHRMGKSCLYFRRLDDLDRTVLRQLVVDAIADVERRHGGKGASR